MTDEWKASIAVIAAAFVLLIAWVWVSAHFEAKAFNRLTGKHVTTWEAVFVELRVQGCE